MVCMARDLSGLSGLINDPLRFEVLVLVDMLVYAVTMATMKSVPGLFGVYRVEIGPMTMLMIQIILTMTATGGGTVTLGKPGLVEMA